ncbi:MAG: chromate efflux transporter [Pseudomonadota bacterium]
MSPATGQFGVDAAPPTISESIRTFGRIGLLSFGGPAAQIALMHRVLVDEKKWLTEKEYLSALSFCMLLPGPEAMQLATYSGWRISGVFGGLVAGILFVLPGAFVVLALAATYAYFGDAPLVSNMFVGVQAAVLIVVIEALLRVSKKALNGTRYWIIAAAAFGGIFILDLPFPLIVFAAALYGYTFIGNLGSASEAAVGHGVSAGQTVKTITLWLFVWIAPIALVASIVQQPVLNDIGLFFSKLAVVTFGGAYAVLAYMAQQVVSDFGWMTANEMMDGLGLAETTPGPLILVTEFVGFLAAFREGGFWLGLLGALVTLWVTFVPCFLWIFAGAPYIEWISSRPRLNGALSAITASVVGVIANLSVWFGLHVLFAQVFRWHIGFAGIWWPDVTTINLTVVAVAAICGVLLLRWRWGIAPVLLAACALSLLLQSFS